MEETPKFFTANCLTIYRITGNYADSPVIVDVKLQNLKANHNESVLRSVIAFPVIVDVKLQNLKANHNPPPTSNAKSTPVIVDVKLQNLKANHNALTYEDTRR